MKSPFKIVTVSYSCEYLCPLSISNKNIIKYFCPYFPSPPYCEIIDFFYRKIPQFISRFTFSFSQLKVYKEFFYMLWFLRMNSLFFFLFDFSTMILVISTYHIFHSWRYLTLSMIQLFSIPQLHFNIFSLSKPVTSSDLVITHLNH